jgi:phosphopantetheinyl transferase (holo-ACP synthase)
MEVAKHDSGEPYVVMHGKGLDLLRERGGDLVHLSISHTAAHATGMAILEKRPAG